MTKSTKTVKSKILFFCAFICIALIIQVFIGIKGSHQIRSASETIEKDLMPMMFAVEKSEIAMDKAKIVINRSITNVSEPENFDQLRKSIGELRKYLIEFDMYNKAILWGSESEQFRNDAGGLTHSQWLMHTAKSPKIIRQAPYDLQQLAHKATRYFIDFQINSIESLKSLKKALRLEYLGEIEKSEIEYMKIDGLIKKTEISSVLISDLYDEIEALAGKHVNEAIIQINKVQKGVTVLIIAFSLLLLIFITAVFFVFSNKVIIRPIRILSETAKEIGKGNLDKKITIKSNDEFGQLAESFNQMVDNLKKTTVSKEYVEKILESTADPIMIMNVNGEISYVNKAFETGTGYSRKEAIGKTANILNSGKQSKEFYESMWQQIRSGSVWKGSLINKKKNGTLYYAEENIAPVLSSNNQITQFIAVIRDVSKRKRIENELKQANNDLIQNERALRNMLGDLQKANQDLKSTQEQLIHSEKLASIGQLAAGVAHEINNPIGFVNSNLQTLESYSKNITDYLSIVKQLQEAFKSKDDKKIDTKLKEMQIVEEQINLDYLKSDIKDLLKESIEGLNRVKAIVLDLRTFARDDSRESAEDVNLQDALESVLGMIASEIRYKAEVKKDYQKVPMIKGDFQKICQVFMNIIMNALHAIEKGGTIEVKTYHDKEFVYAQVSDNGKGIDEDARAKIFDPFFTSKPVGEGTGLGLSISYDIIKKFGGEIIVDSKLNKGATFTVSLPLKQIEKKNLKAASKK